MPRPKKTDVEKLTHRLPHIRCTESDLARIQRNAERAGYTNLSDYIRRMALDGQIVVRRESTSFALVEQIRRLGVNVNQQTRKFNATGNVPDELRRLWAKLETVLDGILDDSARRA